MKHLPAGVDLSKLDIRHTHGVSADFLAAADIEATTPITAGISQLRDATQKALADGFLEMISKPAKKKRPRYGRARKVELDGYIVRFGRGGEAV
jgi:hypothetical protein